MLRIAVCDDDNPIISQVSELLISICEERVIKLDLEVFTDGAELVEHVSKGNHYDIVYLDIEMDDLDGITAARELIKRGKAPLFIYISSYEKYLIELFEVEPFRFIKKPIDIQKFIEIFDMAYERLAELSNYFHYKYNREAAWMPVGDILYFCSDKRTIRMHTIDGDVIFYAKLDEVEKQLEYNRIPFLRIHKSFYVNFLHIKQMNYSYVVLKNGAKLPISDERKKVIRAHCRDLIGGDILG